MVEFLVFLIAALLMSLCSYYLGCIHTWKKASKHLIRAAAQQGVHLTLGDSGENN